MKSKSRAIILSVSLLAAFVCIGAALASPGRQKDNNPPPSQTRGTNASENGQASDVPKTSKYTVTVYQGRLAVYLSDHMDAPQYVTDVDVSTLPSADRQALAGGIPIDSEQDLTSLLEDYSS